MPSMSRVVMTGRRMKSSARFMEVQESEVRSQESECRTEGLVVSIIRKEQTHEALILTPDS